MMIVIDNYDSFTYNIYQACSKFNDPIKGLRNDKTTLKEIESLIPSYIIIGPGPKSPKEAGISIEIVQKFKGIYPILGICLGHQAILSAFGVEIKNAKISCMARLNPLSTMAKESSATLAQKPLLLVTILLWVRKKRFQNTF